MSETRVPRALLRFFTLAAPTLVLSSVLPAFAADTYVKATVEGDGRLRILTASGQTIEPEKQGEQVGFSNPRIAPGGDAVGWLAEYPNCCTSYPIPLKLMVQTNGTVRSFIGEELPIWRWGFQNGGKQVAFEQETVHGGLGVHYELRDIATGRLIAEYDPPVGPDNEKLPTQDVPTWVKELNAGR